MILILHLIIITSFIGYVLPTSPNGTRVYGHIYASNASVQRGASLSSSQKLPDGPGLFLQRKDASVLLQPKIWRR